MAYGHCGAERVRSYVGEDREGVGGGVTRVPVYSCRNSRRYMLGAATMLLFLGVISGEGSRYTANSLLYSCRLLYIECILLCKRSQ